jgi:hypothetical protein
MGQVSYTYRLFPFQRIDVYVILHRTGAASHYLYQYELPGSEIGGGYLHIGILHGPGELYLPAISVPEN